MSVEGGYPPDWENRRKQVYERDGYTCQECGALGGSWGSNELHAHHIQPISRGGSHDLSNLKTLCKDCHEELHGHPIGSEGQLKNPFYLFGGICFIVAGTIMSLTIVGAIVGIPLALFGWLFVKWSGYVG